MKIPLDKIQTIAPIGATLICLALAGFIWLPLNQEAPQIRADGSQNPTASEDNTSLEFLAVGAQSLVERPLFHVTRRPPAEAQVAQAAPEQILLSLHGVVKNNDVYIALVRLSNNPQLSLRRRVGDDVGGWEILDITQTSVTVRTPEGDQQIIGLSSSNN